MGSRRHRPVLSSQPRASSLAWALFAWYLQHVALGVCEDVQAPVFARNRRFGHTTATRRWLWHLPASKQLEMPASGSFPQWTHREGRCLLPSAIDVLEHVGALDTRTSARHAPLGNSVEVCGALRFADTDGHHLGIDSYLREVMPLLPFLLFFYLRYW